ncbi:hypothetical protein QN277_019780 [Acacia crassicarpa]|uniref:Uncharacterized protein n=1 Tax=Acacia crassicarpa TaxID=499986 RepID=A0AAE1KC52_9FABA|nr:hypothetical protein QN277_019780 [Acacia crassicarpa]
MDRESHGHDPTLLHSSIALLQERFRQLQRVKEMREERELLRMLTPPQPKHFIINNSKSELPELMTIPSTTTRPPSPLPSPPPHSHNVSLSLWPSSSSPPRETISLVATFPQPEIPPAFVTTLWKTNASGCDGSDSDSGIDTSLHL